MIHDEIFDIVVTVIMLINYVTLEELLRSEPINSIIKSKSNSYHLTDIHTL